MESATGCRRGALLAAVCVVAVLCTAAVAEAKSRTSVVRNLAVGTGDMEETNCLFCSIRVTGNHKGVLVVIGGGVEIESPASGVVVVVGGGVHVRAQVKFDGDVVVIGGPIVLEEGAAVTKDAESLLWFYIPGQRQVFVRGALTLAAFQLVIVLVGYPLMRKRRTENMASAVTRRPLLTGLLGAVVTTVFIVLLSQVDRLGDWEDAGTWTIFVIMVVLFALGAMGVCASIGRRVRAVGTLMAVLAGTGIILGLALVPVAGFVAYSLAWFLALGCGVVSFFGSWNAAAEGQ